MSGFAAKEYEADIKHPLFPDNSFLITIPKFRFGIGFPANELHALILGVFGDYIIAATVHL